jgi:hypothetical protein
MPRSDLLGLSPEGLAALANVGLVKRAEREVAAGKGPSLLELDDGTVVGTFPDGIVTRLEKGRRLADCPCSCAATGVCRHRVAVVLAYRAAHAGSDGKSETVSAPSAEAEQAPASTTAALDDDALSASLGPRLFEAATKTRARGVVVSVEGEVVHLPNCSVRFTVGSALEYARCDCASEGACEHLALATWARVQATSGTFELAGGNHRPTFTVDADLDRAFGELIAAVVEGGATQPPSVLAERFATLRARARPATWLLSALDDLERILEAYAARSARYSERTLGRAVAEIAGRLRASRRDDSPLPSRWVLGVGEADETLLERLRLVSLGARLAADGNTRSAQIYLADPDAGTVLVLEHTWKFEKESPVGRQAAANENDGPELGKRSVGAGLTLSALAHGQVVTRSAKRLANLGVVIGTRKGTTSLLPGSVDPTTLPEPLFVRRYGPLRERLERRPPRFLRPRLLAESLVALGVHRVGSLGYSPATQTTHAVVEDEAGVAAHLVLAHRAVAPNALDALAAGISAGPRAIVGHVEPTPSGLFVEPIAIATESGLVVLDLAPATAAPRVANIAQRTASPVDEAIDAAEGHLAEAAHRGLRRLPPDFSDRLRRDAGRCERVGLLGFAERLAAFATARDPATWVDAAIWRELLSGARVA